MFRRVIAGIILGPALLIGSFAWWGFLTLRTVLDETRSQTVAEELLDNEAVTDQITANIGRALQSAMPDAIELSDEQVDQGAEIIFDDPVVRDLIIASLGTTHRAFLGLDDAPATIDLGPALASARARVGAVSPGVAEQLPETFTVELPTERIPNASPLKSFLERVVPMLAAVSLGMVLLAFLTTSDRSKVLGKAARWAIGTTAFYLLVGLGLPALLRRIAPDQAEVVAALITALLRAALTPSIVLGGVGVVLLAASMFWPDGSRPSRRAAAPAPAPAPAAVATSAPVARRVAPAPAPRPNPPSQPTTRPVARPAPSGADATTAFPAAPAPPPAPRAPIPPPGSARPDLARRADEPPPTANLAPAADPHAPAPHRPTLPTRAKPPESTDFPAWTGDPVPGGEPPPAPEPEVEQPRWLPPKWVDGHGWVMDADDPRDPPSNARHVDGIGWVVPGPPPS